MPSAVGHIWIVAPNVEPRYCTAAGGKNDGAFVRIEGDNGRRRSWVWERARFEELGRKLSSRDMVVWRVLYSFGWLWSCAPAAYVEHCSIAS